MNGPELIASYAGILRTKVSACWPASRAVFRSHDPHQDLARKIRRRDIAVA